jgi:hypothetical protein
MSAVSLYTPVFFTRSFTHFPLLKTELPASAAFGKAAARSCALLAKGVVACGCANPHSKVDMSIRSDFFILFKTEKSLQDKHFSTFVG